MKFIKNLISLYYPQSYQVEDIPLLTKDLSSQPKTNYSQLLIEVIRADDLSQYFLLQ